MKDVSAKRVFRIVIDQCSMTDNVFKYMLEGAVK